MKFYFVILTTCIFLSTVFSLTACNQQKEKAGNPVKDNKERSEEILDFLITGQADSLATRVNENINIQMPPVVFIEAFRQMENTFGPYEALSDWESFTSSGATLYYKEICFGEYPVRLITAFDPDGKANSLQFVPLNNEE